MTQTHQKCDRIDIVTCRSAALWVFAVIIATAAWMVPSAHAQSSSEPSAVSTDQAAVSLAEACKTEPPPAANRTDADLSELKDYMGRNADVLAGCVVALNAAFKELEKGGKDWDFANSNIQKFIEINRNVLYSIIGPTGIRAPVELLITKIENDIKSVDREISDKTKQDEQKSNLQKRADELRKQLDTLEQAAGSLNQAVHELESRRPEIAAMLRLKSYDEVIKAIAALTDGVKLQTDALKNVSKLDIPVDSGRL